jgi:RNA polymerase sigma-70 factor, ECF subfamily
MSAANIDATVAALWRVESPRVLARLARFVGDLDTAEELAQDTFVAPIEKWRQDGVPDNPAAWLHTTARYLAVDRIRRRDTHRDKVRVVAATSPQVVEHDLTEAVDGDLADDLLGLIFMAAQPSLSPDARSALTLKLVCGLATEDIARAFLVPGPTIAQRVVRAKRTLSAANFRFELSRPCRAARTAGRGTRGHLPRLQRGVLGYERGLVDAHRPVRGGASAGSHDGQPDAQRH